MGEVESEEKVQRRDSTSGRLMHGDGKNRRFSTDFAVYLGHGAR